MVRAKKQDEPKDLLASALRVCTPAGQRVGEKRYWKEYGRKKPIQISGLPVNS